MKILLIEPEKIPRPLEIEPSLKSMQQLVGGPIQAVYPFEEPVALICHEEGKLLGLPPNRVLTDEHGVPYDLVCGTFFLVGVGEERFTSLTEEQIRHYQDKYSREMAFPIPDRPGKDKSRKKERTLDER